MGTIETNRRIICACCRRDITEGYLIVWKDGEPLCYDCAEKRTKNKREETEETHETAEENHRKRRNTRKK